MTGVYGASTVKKRCRRSNRELDEIDEAIVEAVRVEHPATLRGVYYRAVSAGALEKTEAAYRTVGRQLLKLRRDGVIPYNFVTDGTRWVTRPETWSDLEEMLADAASSYRRALWHSQPVDVHIFTEKDAISGVVLPVTEKWDVPLGVLRGYSSESFAHSVAQTIRCSSKRCTFVYSLGDHDPSGVDAWRDFRTKVAGFLGDWVETDPESDYAADWEEGTSYAFLGHHDIRRVTFARLAVTESQIEDFGLLTRPTKRSDTRARGFIGESVEVDALPANVLRELVEKAIMAHIDSDALRVAQVAEQSERQIFERMVSGRTWEAAT